MLIIETSAHAQLGIVYNTHLFKTSLLIVVGNLHLINTHIKGAKWDPMTLITFGSQINGGLNKRGDRALGKIK